MNDDAAGYIVSIPQHYDRSLGPLIFADYAADISHRVAACNSLCAARPSTPSRTPSSPLRRSWPMRPRGIVQGWRA